MKDRLLVIPAINCAEEACVRRTLEMVRALRAAWAHVDITDGIFSTNPTWNDTAAYRNAGLKLEVHFMVARPEHILDAWLAAGAARVIVHVESLMGRSQDIFFELMRACNARGVEFMLSENPDTAVEELYPYLETVSAFQLLAVTPGLSGQSFDERVIAKIKTLRSKAPYAAIEIDGGVNPMVAARVRAAGADIVSAASYIWESEDRAAAFRTLERA